MTVEKKILDKNSAEYKLYIHQQLSWAKSLFDYILKENESISALNRFADDWTNTASERDEARQDVDKIEREIADYRTEYEKVIKELNVSDETVAVVSWDLLNERIDFYKKQVRIQKNPEQIKQLNKGIWHVLTALVDRYDMPYMTMQRKIHSNNAEIDYLNSEIDKTNEFIRLNQYGDEFVLNASINEKINYQRRIGRLTQANEDMLENKRIVQQFYIDNFQGKNRHK